MTLAGRGRVCVVGASSQIGLALLPRLQQSGYDSCPVGRGKTSNGSPPAHVFDVARKRFDPPIADVAALVSLAPLPTIETVLEMATALGVRRVIAFGSTGRFSKAGSPSALEQDFVLQQEQAEQLFSTHCESEGIAWTLFRPTMIYGANMDQSVAFIRSMVIRFGFFPLPAKANGLRQPVHVDDLAMACVAALNCQRTFNRAYDLGGGEQLAFPDLVRRIFAAEGKNPRIVPVPLGVYHLMVAAATALRGAHFVRREMVNRMYRDLTVDNLPALEDFGYRPRPFALRSTAEGVPVEGA